MLPQHQDSGGLGIGLKGAISLGFVFFMVFHDGWCGAGAELALVIVSGTYYHITMKTTIIIGKIDATRSILSFARLCHFFSGDASRKRDMNIEL